MHNKKDDLPSLLEEYDTVIGGGGYGVVKSKPQSNTAVKFLYRVECPGARREFVINRQVYSVLKTFLQCAAVPYVHVVKPFGFVEGGNCVLEKDCYSCAFLMERLYFPLEFAVHAALNGNLPANRENKLVLTSKGNPRGYFYTATKIKELMRKIDRGVKTLADITLRIGLLDGLVIFGARMIPKDAEYVLNIKEGSLYVTMLDFGLFEDFNVHDGNVEQVAEAIVQAQEYNLYYTPFSDAIPENEREACRIAFLHGLELAYDCLNKDDTYAALYTELLRLYNF